MPIYRQVINVYACILEPAFQDHILACLCLLQLVSAETPSLVGQRCKLSACHSNIKRTGSSPYPVFYKVKRSTRLYRVYYVGATRCRKLVSAHHRCGVRSALKRIVCDLRPGFVWWSSYMLCHIKSKYNVLSFPSCTTTA